MPIFSFIIITYILIFLHFNYHIVIWPWDFETKFILVNFISLVLFNLFIYLYIYKPHERVLDEIDARESFLILFKQDELTNIKKNPNIKIIFERKDK